jgi:hypothetical protein
MAWYDITYSCGHEGNVQIIGKTADRESRIAWYENTAVCPECWKTQREAARTELDEKRAAKNAEAAAKAAELELPALIGTEKQITWATTLRAQFLEAADEKLAYMRRRAERKPEYALQFECSELAVQLKILQKRSAKWWIENSPPQILPDESRWTYVDFTKVINDDITAAHDDPDVLREIIAAFETRRELANTNDEYVTVRPETQKYALPIKILLTDVVTIHSPERVDALVKITKAMGYRWSSERGAWILRSSYKTGELTDRAAEAGNALLSAGFAVSFNSQEIADKAINADFEPVTPLWVSVYTKGEHTGYSLPCAKP